MKFPHPVHEQRFDDGVPKTHSLPVLAKRHTPLKPVSPDQMLHPRLAAGSDFVRAPCATKSSRNTVGFVKEVGQHANAPEASAEQARTYAKTTSLTLPVSSRQVPYTKEKKLPRSDGAVKEPDIEPSPHHALVTKVHPRGTLHRPLLQDPEVKGPYSMGSSRQREWACFCVLILSPIWAAAAVLAITVSSMAPALHALRAATNAGLESPLDFTLRLAVAPDKCLGSTAIRPQSLVVLQTCSAKQSQQFLLLKDGTIRSRFDDRFCVTSTPANKLALTLCSQSNLQVFDVRPDGKLALKAKPSECLNLLQGDFAAGVVGMYACGGDLNEVFVYGGGHFLVPILEHELRAVSSFPLNAVHAGPLQQNVNAICGLSVIAFMLSTFFLMKSHPKRQHMLLHCLALGFIACMIILMCSSLLLARTATQEAGRVAEKAKTVASAQTADLDFTLRMTKATQLCLGAESLEDNAKVGLQQCKASTAQQFILKEDGTIRTKTVDGLCITVEPKLNMVALSPCSADESRHQIFSKRAEGQGWLQLHALPSMCLNLLGGDEKAGNIGLYKCGRDLNEVFVYSGGNVAISGLAFQVHQVRQLLRQGSHPLDNDFAGIFTLGGAACFLLLAVPSLVLLAGLPT